jgi:deoxyhypusine monooxygenase
MTVKVHDHDLERPVDASVLALHKALTSENVPLAKRFRALFSLKHLASQQPPTRQTSEAIQAIAAAFSSPSALLKHELAYCLGQTKNHEAVPFLRHVLENRDEDPMCRHEAAEALGALGDISSLDLMKQLKDDIREPTVVRETCDIAVERILWENSDARMKEKLKKRFANSSSVSSRLTCCSDFTSIDPAPPVPLETKPPRIPDLKSQLLDTSLPLFERYRAMFALRDLASPPELPTAVPAIEALAAGFRDLSALFRHEIAFVFGQLSHPASVPSLIATLSKSDEASMVRHEAAEALGSLGDEPGVEDLLKTFLNDPEQVVRESVIVALDMAEYEKNGEMEYATVPGIEVS